MLLADVGRACILGGSDVCGVAKAGLILKPSKAQLGSKEVVYLDHAILADGISVSIDRIKAIQELPKPRNLKELRVFLGVLNFVRRLISNYAEVTAPVAE